MHSLKIHLLKLHLVKPEGRIFYPSDAEFGGITYVLNFIIECKVHSLNKNVFFGTNSQIMLKAMEKGPNRKLKHLNTSTSLLCTKTFGTSEFSKTLCLHCTPAH